MLTYALSQSDLAPFHEWERQSGDLELGIYSIDTGGDTYVCGSLRVRLDKLWPGW